MDAYGRGCPRPLFRWRGKLFVPANRVCFQKQEAIVRRNIQRTRRRDWNTRKVACSTTNNPTRKKSSPDSSQARRKEPGNLLQLAKRPWIGPKLPPKTGQSTFVPCRPGVSGGKNLGLSWLNRYAVRSFSQCWPLALGLTLSFSGKNHHSI